MKKLSALATLIALALQGFAAQDAPLNLSVCDFLKDPLGQNLEELRFNWQLPAAREGAAQSAYRIAVFDAENPGGEPLWDSGKVESEQSLFVPYEGKSLKSRQAALWKVKIWDEGGRESPWSESAKFELGLLDNSDWQASWISSSKAPAPASGFGDWLQPNGKAPRECDCPKDLIGTAYFARCAEIVSKSAEILGLKEDAKAYAELARQVKKAYKEKFVEPDLKLKSDSQTAYLLTLAFDMLEEKERPKVFEHLLKAIERADFHLNTGFVGTPLINPVLTRFGRSDIAYRLLNNETYPSWLYPINQGATTMWERWNSYSHEKGFGDAGMNSFNHYAYGAIGQWLYKDAASLWHDESAPGYKNIIFAPKLGGGLTCAKATKQTPYGLAESNWKIEGKNFIWKVRVPANSTASLALPEGLEGAIINSKPLPDGLAKLKSGSYEIRAKLKN